MKNVLKRLCQFDPEKRPDAITLMKEDPDYKFLTTKNERKRKAINEQKDKSM